jgi:hypothetical protein
VNLGNAPLLDPWPPLLSIIFELDSAEVVSLIDSTGLFVVWRLSGKDDYSNKTRKRAYRPRIEAAIQTVDEEARLRAAWILTRELLQRHPELEEVVSSKLTVIGWHLDAGKLAPGQSAVRELLLTQGTEYDSYRAIKNILLRAAKNITIVDPYLDDTIFTTLAGLSPQPLSVKLLTSRVPPDFSLAARKFHMQFPHVSLEICKTIDFHDRFIIVDDLSCWHLGASLKDAGHKTFMISEIEDPLNCDALKSAITKSWATSQKVTVD